MILDRGGQSITPYMVDHIFPGQVGESVLAPFMGTLHYNDPLRIDSIKGRFRITELTRECSDNRSYNAGAAHPGAQVWQAP